MDGYEYDESTNVEHTKKNTMIAIVKQLNQNQFGIPEGLIR